MNNPFCLQPSDVAQKAKEIRKKVLKMNYRSGQGHTGADLSETDILASIYFRLLRFSAENPAHPDRDRFILSKGHGVGGLYCTLAQAGLLDAALLDTYLQFDSKLPGHPVRQKTHFVEVNTGALGHGLAVGVGPTLAAKKSSRDYRVFVLTGDGELQEGSNWEAAAAAVHFRLDTLIEAVDEGVDFIVLVSDSTSTAKIAPFKDRHPDRLVNVGIAEQCLVGTAAGLALGGFVSVTANAAVAYIFYIFDK